VLVAVVLQRPSIAALVHVFADCAVSYPPEIAGAFVRTRRVSTGREFRARLGHCAFVNICAFRAVFCAIVANAARANVRTYSVLTHCIFVALEEHFRAFVDIVAFVLQASSTKSGLAFASKRISLLDADSMLVARGHVLVCHIAFVQRCCC